MSRLGSANTVTSLLPQLTVLVHVWRLVKCHGMKELSPDWFSVQMNLESVMRNKRFNHLHVK